MDGPGSRGDSRFSLGGYGMSMLSGDTAADMYGNPGVSLGAGRPGTSLQQMSPRGHGALGGGCAPRGMKGSPADMCYEVPTSQGLGGGLDSCGVPDVTDDSYGGLQAKKSPPSNGKKTKGRVKIKMEYIENKLRRYTTFSKRKTGIMKKAYELSTLTGTQVMLLVASETGHVYTFATRKLQPMITSEAGKALIQTCLNSPDPPASSSGAGGDQRMSATGFEETELTYNISDEDSKEDEMSVADSSGDSSGGESPPHDLEQPSNAPPPPPMPPPKLSSNSSSPPPSGPDAKRLAGGQNIVMRPQGGGSALNQQLAAASNLVGPLLYQMPQGVLCSSSTNGVIFSLAQAPNSSSGGDQQPQFITIPLSMAMAASNGHTAELDLSAKRSTANK